MIASHHGGKRKQRDIPGPASPGRFVATIHPGRGQKDLGNVGEMGLDRLPDADGLVRAFVTAGECVALLDAGYEVRLHHHYPIQPADPSLIASKKEAKQWLADRLAEIQPDIDQAKPPRRTKR